MTLLLSSIPLPVAAACVLLAFLLGLLVGASIMWDAASRFHNATRYCWRPWR